MQKLAEICIRRPVFACMLIVALVVIGLAAYMNLGVDRLPSVDLPTVSVRTTLTGANPEEVEREVTKRVEDVVNTIEGITELRSVTGPGVSNVTVTFKLSRNVDVAAQDVRDRVSTILKTLQQIGADPPVVSKFDNDATPVLNIALSGSRSIRELTELADKVVRVQLERSDGVGAIWVWGGPERAMEISLDAEKLAAYHIPVTAVREAVVQQNMEVPGGNVTNDRREASLRTMGRCVTAEDFNNLIVKNINGQLIRVRDLGYARDANKEPRSITRLNGKPTVVLEVRRQSGANTISTIESVKENLKRVTAQLPPDVRVEIIKDQSRYIYAALHEINLHLVAGSVLASLVVLAFMRNWRTTIIAAIAIPASVVATFGFMWAMNFTLNSVTMLALVLMVGVVIDDAIVVLENIFRFVEEKKMNAFQAAREGTKEIGLAVLATTLSLVVIFIPVSFMSSVAGKFLYQFGITAAVAVLVSLFVSFTLTPMMSARLLKMSAHGTGSGERANSRRGFYALIDGGYVWMLRLAMRHRLAVAVLGLGVIATSWPLYRAVKQEYVPTDVDEAEFQVTFNAPEGTSLKAMDGLMRSIEEDLMQTHGVRTVLSTAGASWLGAVNMGNAYVRIAPHEERIFSLGRLWRETLAGHPAQAWTDNYSQRDVMMAIRQKLKAYEDAQGVRCAVRNFPSFSTGGSPFDIDFVFRGPGLQQLAQYSEELRAKAQKLGGIVDADTTLKLDKPEMRVNIDRNRAGDLGISAQDLGIALQLMVGGDDKVSRFRDEALGEDYDVEVRLMESQRMNSEHVGRIYLPRGDGSLIDLSNLARVETVNAPSRIDRLDRQRTSALRAGVGVGFAQADRIAALREAALAMDLPPAYTTTVSGRAKELEVTFVQFLWAFMFSVVLMYIILAMNYESLVHPLTILLSLPLTVPFALLSLWATGSTLNLYSALGLLVLFGVVKKNAILQIDHMNGLRRAGMSRFDAIIQGNRDRLRPILMTTLALVAGMLPLAIGTGPGAEERRAVATVVIGGQTLCLLLTLVVTPVAYSLMDDVGALVRGRRGGREDGGVVHEEIEVAAHEPAGAN